MEDSAGIEKSSYRYQGRQASGQLWMDGEGLVCRSENAILLMDFRLPTAN
jgi:hypothetical protein